MGPRANTLSITYLKSLQESLAGTMERDDRVYVLGEDIVDPYGGAFKVTKGLSTKFPDRVLPMPISEAAIVGVATGLALRGQPVIAEIMFGDFLTLAADQLVNHAAKFHTMYGERLRLPLVVRTAVGGGRGYGPTHSQSLETMFIGVPGLQVLAPSLFHAPGPHIESALSSGKPTLFIEHKLLYPVKLVLHDDPPLYVSYTESEWPTAVVRNFAEGTPDVTLLMYGGMSLLARQVLNRMVTEEVRVTALLPIQLDEFRPCRLVLEQCASTGRIVVAEEGPRFANWAAEIITTLHEHLGNRIETHIVRVGATKTIIPSARTLEEAALPSIEDIEDAIISVLSA